MLTPAEDIEKLVERVTIPSKLDEVCDLEKQKRVGTMKYEPEVDRCTEAITAAHDHQKVAVGDGLLTDEDKGTLSATIKAGEDKKRASEGVLKKKSEIEMADAHASLHLHVDQKRLDLAIKQGKRWKADAPKVSAAERKLAEAKKCRQCYDELRLRTIGPDAVAYGSGGFTSSDGPDRLKGEENIDKLGGPPGGPPRGALKEAADNFVKEAPEGLKAWNEGDALHKQWLKERKELAHKEQKEQLVSNKFKVNLLTFEKKVAEAKKWLVDETGEFGKANGRRRLAAAQEAQRVLNLLLRLTAQSKFTVDINHLNDSIRQAHKVNDPSTFEYGDANIDREIAAGEQHSKNAKDGQQKMYALVKQMEPKAINRDVDALRAAHAAFGAVTEHETVRHSLIHNDLKKDLMASCLGKHANNESQRWHNGATLIASGAQSIKDYEMAQASLREIKDYTANSKVGPPNYLHMKVDCDAFESALGTARNWELHTERRDTYDTAKQSLDFARAAQQARDNLRAAVQWRIMPDDKNISSSQALLSWARESKGKLAELNHCIEEGRRYVIEPHDIQAGEGRYRQVEGEWKRKTDQRLDGEMRKSHYVLETDGTDLENTNKAYQVYHGTTSKSHAADRLLGEVKHAHANYDTMMSRSRKDAESFKCNNNRCEALEELKDAIKELGGYGGRIRGRQAQDLSNAAQLARQAEAAINRRRDIARRAISNMDRYVDACNRNSLPESQFGEMKHAIAEAKKADKEFAFGGRTDGLFTVSDFSKAEKALQAYKDRIAEKRRREEQARREAEERRRQGG